MSLRRGQESLALLYSLGQTDFGRWIEDYLLDPGESHGEIEDTHIFGENAAHFARQTLDLIESGDIECKTQNARGYLKCLLCSVTLLQCTSPTLKAEIHAQRAIRAKPSTTEGQIDEQ